MELLTIKHADFTMTIKCGKFDAIWTKAKNNIGKQTLYPLIPGQRGRLSENYNHIG